MLSALLLKLSMSLREAEITMENPIKKSNNEKPPAMYSQVWEGSSMLSLEPDVESTPYLKAVASAALHPG